MRDSLGRYQSAVVFGGGSDIAKAVVRSLVARGSETVVLAGRDLQKLRLVEDSIARADLRTETVQFDAQDTGSHPELMQEIVDLCGDIDIALLAFGVLGDQRRAEQEPDEALHLLRTNAMGAVSLGVLVADRLRLQGHGSLVLLSSVAVERPRRSNFAYGSSKAAADFFFRGLQEPVRDFGGHIMIVRLGFVHTQMTHGRDAPPFAVTAEQAAQAVIDGVDRKASVIWVPRILRSVMSLARHIPQPIFRNIRL